jgi:hypothetical protein
VQVPRSIGLQRLILAMLLPVAAFVLTGVILVAPFDSLTARQALAYATVIRARLALVR